MQSTATQNQHYNYDRDAIEAIESLLKHYAKAEQYIDQLDGKHNVSEDTSPASTLYHLLMADAEAHRFASGGRHVYA